MNRYKVTLCFHKCRGCAVELPHEMIVTADAVEIEHTGRLIFKTAKKIVAALQPSEWRSFESMPLPSGRALSPSNSRRPIPTEPRDAEAGLCF